MKQCCVVCKAIAILGIFNNHFKTVKGHLGSFPLALSASKNKKTSSQIVSYQQMYFWGTIFLPSGQTANSLGRYLGW
jgi:hypothetical protein